VLNQINLSAGAGLNALEHDDSTDDHEVFALGAWALGVLKAVDALATRELAIEKLALLNFGLFWPSVCVNGDCSIHHAW